MDVHIIFRYGNKEKTLMVEEDVTAKKQQHPNDITFSRNDCVNPVTFTV